MEEKWFYVNGRDRVGPISHGDILNMIQSGHLGPNDYVWKKGFENWKKIVDVSELQSIAGSELEDFAPPVISLENEEERQVVQSAEKKSGFDWSSVDHFAPIFTIKVGLDRGGEPVEYGPYSLQILIKLFKESRISEKTYIFSPGMKDWVFLGDTPVYSDHFSSSPSKIADSDRRSNTRRPFVARLLFHDSSSVYEGVCRDISIGGLQVLVSKFPGKAGDKINLNVHPENNDYHFSAHGQVVRLLEGGQGISLRFVDLSSEAEAAIEKYINS